MCSWRCRRSRRCRCPRSGLAPSPDADDLLSFPRAAVEVVVLGASTASRCDRAFPRLDAAATHLLPLTHGVVSGVGRKTPKGLVVGALGLQPRPAFESRGRGRQGESSKLPWLDRPGGRGGAGSPRASQVAGSRCEGAKVKNPPRARLDPRACAHRPLGVRARRAGRVSHPSRVRLQRGSPGADASEAGRR
jgi:hypothetical protein